MPFTTGSGKVYSASDEQKATAKALLAAYASKANEEPAMSALLAEEVKEFHAKLAPAQRALTLVPSLRRQHEAEFNQRDAGSINFETFEKQNGDELNEDERGEWLSRFEAMHHALEAAIEDVPTVPMRVAFADRRRSIERRRRQTSDQLKEDVVWLRTAMMNLATASSASSTSPPAAPSKEEDDLVEALAALSGPTTPEGQLFERDAPTTATHSSPVSPEDQLSLPIAA